MEAADNVTPASSKESITGTAPPGANQHVRRNPPIAGEAEAIAKAQAGDAQAFETLYSLHKRRVYSLCLRMLGNVAEAEDLTQEAFPAALPQDRDVPRRLGIFDMAAPARGQRSVDAPAEKRPPTNIPGRGTRAFSGRWPTEGPWCPGFDSLRLLRPCYARASGGERTFPQATGSSSSSTMWRVMNITKLPGCWNALLAIASRNFIKQE